MTENFRASEMDALFDLKTVKVSMAGSYLKESCDLIRRGAEANPHLQMVVRSLDTMYIPLDKDYMIDFDYPNYLYDQNIFNDVSYLLNRTVFFDNVLGILTYTQQGGKTTNFDDYNSWWRDCQFGREVVLNGYFRSEFQGETVPFTSEMERKVRENIAQNVASLAQEYPDIQFYCFYPPYSIVWWDRVQRQGALEVYLCALETASDMLLQYDNVKLFSFAVDYDTILNLDEYKDDVHYSQNTNSKILRCMKDGTYQLTRQNNADYWKSVRSFIKSFDFDAYLAEQGYTAGA